MDYPKVCLRRGEEAGVLKALEDYAARVEVFNLAESPGFEESYISYMNF